MNVKSTQVIQQWAVKKNYTNFIFSLQATVPFINRINKCTSG